MKKIVTIIVLVLALFANTVTVNAYGNLNKNQKKIAKQIAEITIDNWDTYHVLPSVAVGQAFNESSLGEHNPNYNMWGICSGGVYYGSVKEGVLGYLGVINNGHYPGAPGQTDYRKQLRKILDGGYCQPEGSYYPDTIGAIEHYGWDKWDKEILKKIEEEKKEKAKAERQEKQQGVFSFVYDSSLDDPYTLKVCKEIIPKNSVVMFANTGRNTDITTFNTTTYKKKRGVSPYTIYTAIPELDGLEIEIAVVEECKG